MSVDVESNKTYLFPVVPNWSAHNDVRTEAGSLLSLPLDTLDKQALPDRSKDWCLNYGRFETFPQEERRAFTT